MSLSQRVEVNGFFHWYELFTKSDSKLGYDSKTLFSVQCRRNLCLKLQKVDKG